MKEKHNYNYDKLKKMISIFSGLTSKYKYIREHTCFSSKGYDQTLEQYRKDTKRIHLALDSLSPIQSYIITQSFLSNGQVSNSWWKGIYTKSTYYRLRQEAIRNFLTEYDRVCIEVVS